MMHPLWSGCVSFHVSCSRRICVVSHKTLVCDLILARALIDANPTRIWCIFHANEQAHYIIAVSDQTSVRLPSLLWLETNSDLLRSKGSSGIKRGLVGRSACFRICMRQEYHRIMLQIGNQKFIYAISESQDSLLPQVRLRWSQDYSVCWPPWYT